MLRGNIRIDRSELDGAVTTWQRSTISPLERA